MSRLIDAEQLKRDLSHDTPEELAIAWSVSQIIDNAPIVDAATVVHAHWITRNWGEPTMDLREICEETICSNCGKEGGDFMKYCPTCGAKMDEEVN